MIEDALHFMPLVPGTDQVVPLSDSKMRMCQLENDQAGRPCPPAAHVAVLAQVHTLPDAQRHAPVPQGHAGYTTACNALYQSGECARVV